ncbi:MAG: LamG domain-containing protein, partial [Candidatus Bathyarchaeia archaeon]
MPNEYEWNFVIYNAENSVNRPNDICFYIHNRTGGYGIGAYVREVITINEWIFITGVIQDDVLKIYKNGVLKNASRNYTGIIIPEDGNAPLNIGKRDYPEFFMGKIDDVRIYSYALSDDEILNLYHSYFSKTYKILYISAIHIEDDAIYVTPVYVTDVFHDTINCILRFRVLEHPLGHQQLLSASTNTSDALKPINELPILKILNVSDIVEINYKNCNYTQLSVEQEPLTNNYWITYAGQANSVTINSTEIPEFTFVAIIATLLFAALGIIIFKVLVPCIRE